METHILIVDEESTMKSLYSILKDLSSSFHIQCFDNLSFASNYVLHNHAVPHIVFLGVEVNRKSSITIATQLMQMAPSTKIIFLANNDEFALKALSIHAYGYLIKPISLEMIRNELFELTNFVKDKSRIQIRTFGSFEILINQVPINFSRKKSKEILAYLVDRCGASVTRKEIASVLWKDCAYTRQKQNHLQILMGALQKDLRKMQADHIICRGNNHYSVDPSTFTCDLYQLMKGDSNACNTYHGEYMINYNWAKLNNYFRMKMHV